MDGAKDASSRTNVYVDGENLYYGVLRDTPYRWLNLVELVRASLSFVPRIRRLRYFTIKKRASHKAHVQALEKLPEMVKSHPEASKEPELVSVHYGKRQIHRIRGDLTNLPVAGATILSKCPTVLPEGDHEVHWEGKDKRGRLPVREQIKPDEQHSKGAGQVEAAETVRVEIARQVEKQSDVKLATHLLNDAWKDEFDVAVVVSNDTDLIEPIEIVRKERGKRVHVLCPLLVVKGRVPPRVARGLREVANTVKYVRETVLEDAQLPDLIPGTDLCRPDDW